MITKSQVSGLIHLVGAELSVAALAIMECYAYKYGNGWHSVSFSIFGASLILLYTASTLYHLIKEESKARKVLRYIDHMMIFVLIAGTYTPVCLVALRGAWGWSIFGGIWGIAAFGMVIKGIWFNIPRWVSTGLYVLMGWLVIIAIVPLANVLPGAGIAWLAAGGVMYSIGGIVYGIKKPDFNFKFFGFHEFFHVFVILGSFCHFWLMIKYIVYV